MEHKFLSDGRKVAVIGKLNNTEFIVREVFVTEGGDEIPSGESFTTKSLHDKPVESWLKREEAQQKKNTERAKAEAEKINVEINDLKQKLLARKALLANSPQLEDFAGESASLMAAFMTGTIEYLVIEDYGLSKPVKMADYVTNFETNWGRRSFEGLKLASVLGKSDGKLEYRIHYYSDGSGGSYLVHPFETFEGAVNKIKELALIRIEGGRFSPEQKTLCDELGIAFSADEKQKIYALFSKAMSATIEGHQKTLDDYSKKLSDAKALLSSLKVTLGVEP
jgi:hypothetical protein